MPHAALIWHLQNNLYPPIGGHVAAYAEQAIAAVDEGRPEQVISGPSGASVAAGAMVEDLHLDDFLKDSEDCE